MAIDVTNLATPKGQDPSTPALPALKDQQKKLKQYQKDQKQVQDLKKDIDQSVAEINKNLENTFGKAAKQIVLLRLDMVADKLERINPRWASDIDAVANFIDHQEN